jgi:hypothetical protein
VVDDEIEQYPDAALRCLAAELDEVAEAAQATVDGVVVADVVAGVAHRAGVNRVEPEGRHPEPGEVVEPADQALEVAAAVAIGVLVGVHLEAVDDRLLVPPVRHDPPRLARSVRPAVNPIGRARAHRVPVCV